MRIVSFLPLSHIAGLQFDITNHLWFGCQVFFAKPDALQGTLKVYGDELVPVMELKQFLLSLGVDKLTSIGDYGAKMHHCSKIPKQSSVNTSSYFI